MASNGYLTANELRCRLYHCLTVVECSYNLCKKAAKYGIWNPLNAFSLAALSQCYVTQYGARFNSTSVGALRPFLAEHYKNSLKIFGEHWVAQIDDIPVPPSISNKVCAKLRDIIKNVPTTLVQIGHVYKLKHGAFSHTGFSLKPFLRKYMSSEYIVQGDNVIMAGDSSTSTPSHGTKSMNSQTTRPANKTTTNSILTSDTSSIITKAKVESLQNELEELQQCLDGLPENTDAMTARVLTELEDRLIAALHIVSENKKAKQRAESECKICMDNEIDVVLTPCGHMCICYACALRMKEQEFNISCPICSTTIFSIYRTYKA